MLFNNKFLYWEGTDGVLYHGNTVEVLREIPDKYVSCVVTSPPYYNLRNYGTNLQIWDGDKDCDHDWIEDIIKKQDGGENGIASKYEERKFENKGNFCLKCWAWRGELGLEPNFNLYVKHLCDIFDEIYRVLRDDGTLWVNIGDTTYGGGRGGKTKYQTVTGKMVRNIKYGEGSNYVPYVDWSSMDYKKKCECAIPERFAIEMINRGWIRRNTIIWKKNNAMPQSFKDRLTVDFEYVYFFVKNKKYYFEQQFEPLQSKNKRDREVGKGGFDRHRKIGYNSKYNNSDLSLYKFSKYKDKNEETNNRCGMNMDKDIKPYSIRERINEIVVYRNLPDVKKFSLYINEMRIKNGKTIQQIEEYFGNMSSHHWFNGESFPNKNDYLKLRSFLLLDSRYDDNMLKEHKKMSKKVTYNQCRNKRTTWDINTKSYIGCHFATFPLELVKTPIKAGCPEFICKKCGNPRKKIYKDIDGKKYLSDDLSDCDCGVDFESGMVLDPFVGSGTTCMVAKKLNRRYIGIDINKNFLDLSIKRIKDGK